MFGLILGDVLELGPSAVECTRTFAILCPTSATANESLEAYTAFASPDRRSHLTASPTG